MLTDQKTFGVLGVPIDTAVIEQVIDRIDQAIAKRQRLLISTINTNFLVKSKTSQRFRLSLLMSDICTVDGIGMLLMCRLASIQDVGRVSGADLLERLIARQPNRLGRPLRVFFFGGNEAIADRARHEINRMHSSGICCVGSLNPGFGSMEDLSSHKYIEAINDAHADFLITSLGAERGQEWFLRNGNDLNVPVCAHLGAAVNFVAGSIMRAPRLWQKLGLEWAWRIGQEPELANRYWHDGLALVGLLVHEALPLAISRRRDSILRAFWPAPLRIELGQSGGRALIRLSGSACDCVNQLADAFTLAVSGDKGVLLDCRDLRGIDAACLGQILRLERDLHLDKRDLTVVHMSKALGRQLNLAKAVPT